MGTLRREDIARIARLSRLHVTEAESARLAPTLEAITRDIARLAEDAARAPPPDEDAPGGVRADEVAPAPQEAMDAILRNARVDLATRTVLAHE